MFANKEKLESFVGRNTHFKGDIVTKGTIRIDGRVSGTVEADWLVLGEKAFIKGNVSVGGMVIGGTVEGNVTAKEHVEIKRKGQVKGDIVTAKITVLEGGVLDGRITMNRESSKVVELSKEA
jgi:cytoskeletal protein CcmA (bactofilin family)